MRSRKNQFFAVEEAKIEIQEKYAGTEFFVFMLYLLFVFLNPQNFVPGLKVLRPALLISAFAFILFVANGQAQGAMKFPQSKLLVMLVGLSFLATLKSIDFDISTSYWFYYIKALFMYLLFLFAAANMRRINSVLWVMLLLMFVDVVVSLVMQKLNLIGYRLVSFDEDGGANDYALMILSMMPFALHFMEYATTKQKRWFSGACLLAFLLALMRTRSRMGFVGLILIMAQVLWAKRKKPIVIFVVLGLVMIALLNTHYAYFKRVESIDTQRAQGTRTKLWDQAYQLIQLKPWFGVGPGNYVKAKQYFGIPGDKEHVAHNAFLELGAENGVIALAVYVLIAAVSLKNLIYAEKHFRNRNDEFYNVSMATRIAYVVLLSAMVALSQQYNHFYFIFAALSARLKQLSDESDESPLREIQNR